MPGCTISNNRQSAGRHKLISEGVVDRENITVFYTVRACVFTLYKHGINWWWWWWSWWWWWWWWCLARGCSRKKVDIEICAKGLNSTWKRVRINIVTEHEKFIGHPYVAILKEIIFKKSHIVFVFYSRKYQQKTKQYLQVSVVVTWFQTFLPL